MAEITFYHDFCTLRPSDLPCVRAQNRPPVQAYTPPLRTGRFRLNEATRLAHGQFRDRPTHSTTTMSRASKAKPAATAMPAIAALLSPFDLHAPLDETPISTLSVVGVWLCAPLTLLHSAGKYQFVTYTQTHTHTHTQSTCSVLALA